MFRRLVVLSVGLLFGAGVMVVTAGQAAPSDTVSFPDCFEHPIQVGPDNVYSGAPARCNTSTSSVPPSTTSPTTTTVPPSTSSSTTSSTLPPPSTTVAPTSSTSTSTSTTLPPPTTTTQPATTTTVASGAPGCGLASAAFCDTFDAPHPVAGTRTGDLDPMLWGVTRINTGHTNVSQGQFNDWLTPVGYTTCVPGTYCAQGTPVPGVTFSQAPGDIRIVNGRLFDAVSDGTETKTQLEMYPKQPFDWTGRTGHINFDVSMDSESPHAAWPELWITDRPVPSTVPTDELWPNAKNAIGFTMAGSPGCAGLGVDQFGQTVNYQTSFLPVSDQSCLASLTHASTSGALTHIHVEITSTTMKVYGQAPGDAAFKLIGATSFAPINFTKGLVWLTDAHYNACKFDAQCDHAFAWDNFGFDGPKTYRDWTFDVPDALTPSNEGAGWNGLGYVAPAGGSKTVTTGQVIPAPPQTPTSCAVMFNANPTLGTVPDIQVNGGTVYHTAWPGFTSQEIYKAFDVVVPCSDVHYGVRNTITFKPTAGQDEIIANVNILLVNAAPVP